MNIQVGPNLLHVHAVAHQRSVMAAAEKDRLLLQAGATWLPFGIARLPIARVASVLQTAIASIATLAGRQQDGAPMGRLPVGGIQAQPAS